ncbi:uncharacterized protein LOC135822553 [Sycon ciliatum]|uniref:uncharacterized protein LOC135822553 n=1 Tax=Sycon ciliatum TaxID=27933 RepID=UPI0031F68DCF
MAPDLLRQLLLQVFMALAVSCLVLCTSTANGQPRGRQQAEINCQAFAVRRELAIDGFETEQINVGECRGYCRQGSQVAEGKLKFRKKRKVFKLRVDNKCECCQVTKLQLYAQRLTPLAADAVATADDENGLEITESRIPQESMDMVHRRRDATTNEWYYEAHVHVVGGCGCARCNDTIKPRVPIHEYMHTLSELQLEATAAPTAGTTHEYPTHLAVDES